MSDRVRSLDEVKAFLRKYSGETVRIMEVCGTHTGVIARSGLESLLSDHIRLIAGPGCPVCVTVTSFIDRLCAFSMEENTTVLTFGDLIRVPGSSGSLADAKAQGGSVQMLYSPADAVKLAREHQRKEYVFAAAGFETTAPVYAEMLAEIEKNGVRNLRLLTALKTMPEVIRKVVKLSEESAGYGIDGFIAPGHVAVITGGDEYAALASELGIPFAISSFRPEGILMAIYSLVRDKGKGICRNLYPSAVTPRGNELAKGAVEHYFMKCDAAWRGMGVIADSGLMLRPEYVCYDAGSSGLIKDDIPDGCCCGQVLTGLMAPYECPMFGTACTPEKPYGACMVSEEGSCRAAMAQPGGMRQDTASCEATRQSEPPFAIRWNA